MRIRIDGLMDKVAEYSENLGPLTYLEWQDVVETLTNLPDVAVSALQRIQSDPRFQEGWVRAEPYKLLSLPGARDLPDVRKQLLEGLTEPNNTIVVICAKARSHAEESVQRIAVEKLVTQWDFPSELLDGHSRELCEKLKWLAAVIKALGQLGGTAETVLKDIEIVFTDARLNPEKKEFDKEHPWTKAEIELDGQLQLRASVGRSLKGASLRAIFDIGGLGRVLRHLEGVDLMGREMLLGGFGYQGAETNGIFDGNPEHQQVIRRFVIESFESPSRDVRNSAVEALIFVFGNEIIQFDSPTEYRLNPQIEQALEKMAATDPDKGLRERSAGGLQQLRDRLDNTAKNILHCISPKSSSGSRSTRIASLIGNSAILCPKTNPKKALHSQRTLLKRTTRSQRNRWNIRSNQTQR